MTDTCTRCGRTKRIHARHMCRACYDAATGNLHNSEGERIKTLTWAQIDANIAAIVAASEANGGQPPNGLLRWREAEWTGALKCVKVG